MIWIILVVAFLRGQWK